MQQLAGRTAVGIGCSIIAEVLAGEAAFLLELTVAFVRRHVGLDAVILAGLEILTVIIAGIGQYLHGLGFENLLGRFCHFVEMACIAAIDDLAFDDQLVLVVNDALNVVAGNGLVALAQKPCIRIGLGHLSLITGLQILEIGPGAFTLGHQLLHFVPDIATAALVAIPRTIGALPCLRRVVGVERRPVSLDLLVQFGDLFGQLPAREDAVLAGIAVEQGAIDRNKSSADQVKLTK